MVENARVAPLSGERDPSHLGHQDPKYEDIDEELEEEEGPYAIGGLQPAEVGDDGGSDHWGHDPRNGRHHAMKRQPSDPIFVSDRAYPDYLRSGAHYSLAERLPHRNKDAKGPSPRKETHQ